MHLPPPNFQILYTKMTPYNLGRVSKTKKSLQPSLSLSLSLKRRHSFQSNRPLMIRYGGEGILNLHSDDPSLWNHDLYL
ncbi:hypothetical protein L1987_03443 [Smallanthus sonchifolius]|uniref:Uncharacterized protein n=1 Tax=Smallanthus sonchifolius TaxID=185202 RepID=A0ACB9KAP3_9ASTR|nr:hypothetical protein L1987_03443 [Smallanthus sonchifolius]